MKENIEDISADIELQYGQPNMERNIAYVLSLVEAHATEDGRLDDDIPVPSIEAAAKTILLLIDRPELSWETICREQREADQADDACQRRHHRHFYKLL